MAASSIEQELSGFRSTAKILLMLSAGAPSLSLLGRCSQLMMKTAKLIAKTFPKMALLIKEQFSYKKHEQLIREGLDELEAQDETQQVSQTEQLDRLQTALQQTIQQTFQLNARLTPYLNTLIENLSYLMEQGKAHQEVPKVLRTHQENQLRALETQAHELSPTPVQTIRISSRQRR